MNVGPDLSGHGILEAHAGTGKTYTIVRMVLSLLERERMQLHEILLVTYTQKAAGELVERIRAGIALRIGEVGDPVLEAHLRGCLAQLGECWIGTIHGVSLRILRAWPFESGLPFRTELVDDDEGLEEAARSIWRGNPWRLATADLDAIAAGESVGKLFDRVLDLARARLDPDMVLIPEGDYDANRLEEARHAIRDRARDLERAEVDLRKADDDFVPWLRPRFEALGRLDRSAFTKSFEGACQSASRSWSRILETGVSRRHEDPRGSRTGKSVAELMGKKDASIAAAQTARDLLEEVLGEWTRLYGDPLGRRDVAASALDAAIRDARARVLASWASRTASAWKSRKRKEGWISYADMLEMFRDALADDGFRSALRRRIRVGIIDEFQDTSALQWDIFRRWFLDDNPDRDPRLHVVGDPKQSIYSFQGADVRTYLAACARLREEGASTFPLRSNWRSLPELVEATNNLLTSVDWFGPGIVYDEANRVRTPERDGDSARPKVDAPVRLVALDGAVGIRRAGYARAVASTILGMVGREVRLPEGAAWESRALAWGDFAVVIQNRTGMAAFRRAFAAAGIPWALYKEQGVFVSRAARELRAVLGALRRDATRGDRLRALLTRFFGIALQRVDPAVHLEPGHPAAELLETLAELADARRWSRLFRELRILTGVESRILAGDDGDRHWMDLRQTMDEALSFLVTGRGGLAEVVEHLDRLARERIEAGEDRNLHARATDRGRVQILTMHVSKGLEFPVVFLAPSTPSTPKGEPRWIEEVDGRLRLHAAVREASDAPLAKVQREEEIARLLYVALTRAKFATVVPVHARGRGTRQDRLSAILEGMGDSLPEGVAWTAATEATSIPPVGPVRLPVATGPRIDPERLASLDLPARRRVLSSYSAISHSGSAPGPEGRGARAEERGQDDTPIPGGDSAPSPLPDAWLPRGARTGDCLHELLESLLKRQDLSWCSGETRPDWFAPWVERVLRTHGLPADIAPDLARMLLRILASPLPLDAEGDTVRLCDLPPADRHPEVEFHCAIASDGGILDGSAEESGTSRGWLVGYIDLLFRFRDAWHVLDWKTTSLPAYDPASLERAMDEHDYRFQSSLYAHVVSRSGVSRTAGAVYVFLRAAADDLDGRGPLPGVWTCPASGSDGERSRDRIAAWLRSRDGRRDRIEVAS